jgi:hypothetical protein
VLVEDDRLSGGVNRPGHHLPILVPADVEQLVLGLRALEDLVLEDVPVVLEEVDVADVAGTHAEVHGLVGLQVLHSLHHCHRLRLAPVPQGDRPVHVVAHHVLGVERRLRDAVQQGSDPLRPSNPARLSGEYELLAVGEELDVVGGRSDEIDVDGFSDSYVVLDDGVGDGDDVGGDGVCGDGDGGGLVALERDGLVLGEVEEGDFVVRAGEEDVGVELVDVDDVGVLVGVKLVGVLVGLVRLVVAVLQDETVGVAAVERVLEGLHLVEHGRSVADAQALRVGDFSWLRN